jgi:S-adenosylmethionine-diacylgycerolhomoserine-N-methlytransferase
MSATIADLGILWRLLRGQPRSGTAAERLEAFYRPQAARYDAFRERLLRGRREMIALLAPQPGSRVVELGCGTGRNLDFFGERIDQFASVEIVDLCPALLEQARARCGKWRNVRVIEGDATAWRPQAPVDCVYLSYSLTMIPNWRCSLENALAMLRPGGRLGVVDFHAPERMPAPGVASRGALARWGWPRWFAHDGVYLDPGHLPYLFARTSVMHLRLDKAAVPYLGGLKAPYFIYVGVKPGAPRR